MDNVNQIGTQRLLLHVVGHACDASAIGEVLFEQLALSLMQSSIVPRSWHPRRLVAVIVTDICRFNLERHANLNVACCCNT